MTICTVYNTPFKPVADITVPIMQEYCERHGYGFHHRLCDNPKRDIIWERLEVVKEAAGPDGGEHVVWMDADVLITNHVQASELWMCDDTPGFVLLKTEGGAYRLNDGVFSWPLFFYNDVLEQLREMEPKPESKLYCPQDFYERLFMNGCEDGKPMQHQYVQSILNEEYGITNAPHQQWQPGHFALHLPGMTNERRVELLKKHLLLIQR